MTSDDMDRAFSHADDIVPSSGFAAGVMDAVRHEASTPPPIPFPWRQAIPGLAAWALTLAGIAVAVYLPSSHVPAPPVAKIFLEAVEEAGALGTGWIALALAISFVSFRVSMRLAGGRN